MCSMLVMCVLAIDKEGYNCIGIWKAERVRTECQALALD